MPSRYELFDRNAVSLSPLAERGHDLTADACLPLVPPGQPYAHPKFGELVEAIVAARRKRRPVVVLMGAHPIKLGLSPFLVDLVERRIITHLGTNGAGIIHDFELASFGGTSENVARWIRAGQFGLWQETSRLNDIIRDAAGRDEGLGEAVGRAIEEQPSPWRHLSIAAAGWRSAVPITSHVAIGSDIIHAHPNCDGGALGRTSYTDFLIFARAIQDLEEGVFLNVGTSIMGPEVYLKALSMSRNANAGRQSLAASPFPRHFTTAVFDLVDLPEGWQAGPPSKDHPLYYYRPWKTILVRTVADGGASYYFSGDHRQTIPTLWSELVRRL